MELKFNNGKFRILMIADTQEGRSVNPNTIRLIEAGLDESNPDMVVYSGDQIWGYLSFKGSREEVKRVLGQLVQPVIDRGIPFAVCFGNHDRQVGLSNEEQFEIYKEFDGFIGESAQGIDGVGNHCFEIKDGDDIKYLLYTIDSNSSLQIGYDNVHENQINWYRATRDKYEELTGAPVPSVVIQHIPVCEVFQLMHRVKPTKRGAVRGFRTHDGEYFLLTKDRVNDTGFMRESPADPQVNSGEFDAFKEKGEVKGLYFGHDHNNSFNGDIDGIDVGYTQGCGFNVYGPGKDRGVRVIDLFSDGHISTYDLRYRDIVGNSVQKPLKYAFVQLSPVNVYDAVTRITKALGIIAAVLVAALIITMLT
ncbi:MAG: metallophosphoesterase family protein [Eubacteriales bacterium]|nr:metallophosphoesterase family protein [Eubacteriales bacterium]